VCIHIQIHACVFPCRCVYVCVCVCVCICVCICVCFSSFVCMHVYMYALCTCVPRALSPSQCTYTMQAKAEDEARRKAEEEEAARKKAEVCAGG
jgi:hypothetical protein